MAGTRSRSRSRKSRSRKHSAKHSAKRHHGGAKGKSKLGSDEAYCMRCKKPVKIREGKVSTMKNGRKILKGVCANCGTKVSKIGV